MSNTIDDSHFGLNFVADYERIGSRPWERYDDIVARLNINQVRYPGGTTAETVFDYRHPDATQFTTTEGETLKLTPLSRFIDYCNQYSIHPTIIVPTAVLLSATAEGGHRIFDESQTDALAHFFKKIMQSVDPNLKVTFEVGNEYETYMSATEYGRVANRVAEIITETVNGINSQTPLQGPTEEPDIIVQAWGYSVGGGMTYEELEARNLQVISQFSSESLSAVDGVSSHLYFSEGRNAGTESSQSFDLIRSQIGSIANLHESWEIATGRDLISSATEWNVLFRSTNELGLKQIRPIMELFTGFLDYGFDSLDFWSAQYHATSIADASGRLMAAGAVFNVLKPAVLGTEFRDATHSSTFSTYSFGNDDKSVEVVVSNLAHTTSLDLTALYPGRMLVNGFTIGVDERTADGNYRDLSGLLPYAEPDATITSNQLSMAAISGAVTSVLTDPFETLILIYATPDPSRSIEFGTDYADIFDSEGVPTMFIGGSNLDTVRYLAASSGVYADLGSDPSAPHGHDTFVSIEMLRGSSYNDTLIGATASDYLFGGSGDDYIAGEEGFDTIDGGGGADTILGGLDDDELRGGDGDDFIVPNGGADRVFGGLGQDTLSFADYLRGVSVWVGSGIVESYSGLVSFSGVEVFVGTSSDDLFDASGQDGTFLGGGGNDVFRSLVGGAHFASGESGDDLFFFFEGFGNLSGGDGKDAFYTYGSHNRLSGGEGDDVFYAHGSHDEFVFFENPGRDVIYGFNTNSDSLIFSTDLHGRFALHESDFGTSVIFDDGSSVEIFGTYNMTCDSIVFM